ncbi:MAG: flagellar basal body-associated FliL family protein [Dehalococcoidia bacterium]
MSKPIILAIGGAVAGVAVAFAAFTFFLGGGAQEVEAAPTEVVRVAGKLGPHITLGDRVFNLLPEPGTPAVYLKLQTVIEFETTDPRWEHVLHGCGADDHGARLDVGRSEALASAAPGGLAAPARGPAAGGASGDPCEAELVGLMAAFEHRIGTGRSLIEDAVTTIVTGHTPSEIATPAGKEALKAEIKAAVQRLFDEQRVSRVLFLNFITQ